MRTIILAMMAAAIGFAPAVLAQQAAETPGAQMRAACASDVQTLCAGAPAGPERRKCLMANLNKVSEGCRSAIGAVRAVAAERRTACAEDLKQYCAGSQGPARMQCLRQNQDKLSSGCQSALSSMPARGGAR